MITQDVFKNVDSKFKWAWIGLNGSEQFSTVRPRWSENSACWISQIGTGLYPLPHGGQPARKVSAAQAADSLLERFELSQSVFHGEDPKWKYAHVGQDGKVWMTDVMPANCGSYWVVAGVAKASQVDVSTIDETRWGGLKSWYVLEREEQSMPGQEIFEGYGPDWKWAVMCGTGQVYLCDVKPVFNTTGWSANNASWEKVRGAKYPEWASDDRWKTWLLEREECLPVYPVEQLAPLELAKLYLQDARHNAAVMVDAGRLTIDQFNEIFSEQ